MTKKLLVRALGEFEIYQFMHDISDFEEFYNANEQNFNIFEIAKISDTEKTILSDQFTVYDLTLEQSGEHFWLMHDTETGMYEPVEDIEQANKIAGLAAK